MIKIRFLEKIEEPFYLKKARGNEKLHKLEPSEIFQRLTFTRLDDLKALKDKHWVVIVNRLTKFLKTGKYRQTSKSSLEAVICKIFNALDGRFLNVPQIKNFIKVVKLSAFFNPNEPISPKLQTLAEKLFKPGNLMVLRLAELGRMYNLIGLIHAAINFNDDLFILLQHRAIDFSLPTFIPYHLAKSVLLNLRYDSILKLFNLPTSLPPESYHLVLLNKRLNPEQKAILVNKILEKGVPTDFLYDNVEPIHLAFEFNLPAVTHLLASRPFKKENARKYFNFALQLNHADTADSQVQNLV